MSMRSRLNYLTFVAATLTICLIPLQLTANPLPQGPPQPQNAQNQKAQADHLFNKGVEQYRRRQYQEALQTYQQVLGIRLAIGDKAGIGRTLHNIGILHSQLYSPALALDFLQQALAIKREIGDKAGVGRTLFNIGAFYEKIRFDKNQPQAANKALEFYRQALAISQEIGDPVVENEIACHSQLKRQFPHLKCSDLGVMKMNRFASGEASLIFDDDDKKPNYVPLSPPLADGSPMPDRDVLSESPMPDRDLLQDDKDDKKPTLAAPSGERDIMPAR